MLKFNVGYLINHLFLFFFGTTTVVGQGLPLVLLVGLAFSDLLIIHSIRVLKHMPGML